MKKYIATLTTIAILTGSFVTPLPWADLNDNTIVCQAASTSTKTVTVSGISYTLNYNQSTKQATITGIKKTTGNLPSKVTIPEKITINSVAYVVTELGNGSSALFTANNAVSMSTLTLPVGLKKINAGAFKDDSIPKLSTLYLNIDGLSECYFKAFKGTKVKTIYNRLSDNNCYSITEIAGFDSCFGDIRNRKAFTRNGGKYYLKDTAINAKLQFLNSVSMTPFSVEVGKAYAERIVNELFKSGVQNYTKLQRAEIIFNYLHTHGHISTLYDTNTRKMYDLSAQPMSRLALGSGVCGSYAHSFEFLCKAAGFTADEVYCCPMPQHVANAVKIDGEYYYVDAMPAADVFMHTCGLLYKTSVLDKQKNCYHYTASSPEQKTPITIAGDMNNPTFVKNFSYIYIACDPDVTVSLYDKNKSYKEYIHYSTSPAVTDNEAWNSLKQYANNQKSKLFIDTNTYYNLTITVNGKTSQPIENAVLLEGSRTITVDGKKYKVTAIRKPMGKGDSACDNRLLSSSDDKYFNVTIEKLN